MPRLSNLLLLEIKDLRSGLAAAERTAQELTAYEDHLFLCASQRLAVLDMGLLAIHNRINSLPVSDLNSFLKLNWTLRRVSNSINKLERFRLWWVQHRQTSHDLDLSLLLLEADPVSDALIPVADCSSIKTKKIYSKFPPRQAFMDLTDEQWQLVQSHLPRKEIVTPGRPPQSMREVLDAIFWKIRTGAPWDQIPQEYPSHQTCYRYYTVWMREQRLKKIIRILGKDLRTRGGLDIRSAVSAGQIQVTRVGRKFYVSLVPHWQDTWKGSIALVILQFLFKELPPPPRPVAEKTSARLVYIQEFISSHKNLK
jgi:transposase